MSFYVDYNEFRNFKYSVVSQLAIIGQNLETVDVTLSNMIASPAMDGEGAENIYSYLYDMISNTIPIISTIIVDFSSKLSLLEAGLYDLEPETYGVLPEEEIVATVNAYKTASYDIRELSDEVNGVINDLSGICEFEKPSVSKLTEHMDAVVTRGTLLRQCVEALDESHYNTELAQLEELLDSAIELIDTLNNQSWNVTDYQLGAFSSLPEYTAMAEELVDTIEYHDMNQEELALAQELCSDKLEDVLADERISEGLNKIFFGADSSSLGFGTLWLARLVAVPWYVKLASFGIAVLGGFEAVEGAQDVIYGSQGDAYTDSTNALKDLLGEDNYYKALECGTLVTGGYLLGKSVYDIAKSKLASKNLLTNPSAADDVVPVGADFALLDDMGKFTDDVLENNYNVYVNRKVSKGQTPKNRLEWKQSSDYWTKESPLARGNNFNKTVRDADIYDYHEVHLENGKRLDSYDPDAGEIISRKATDLDKINEETYRRYLSEFSQKYSEGTKIRSNAYPELDGQELKGQYILEIPASNANISNIEYYKQIAGEYNVLLRFTEEVQ